MDPLACIIGIGMAAGVLFIVQPLFKAWLQARRSSLWVITCPAASQPALIELRRSAIPRLRGHRRFRIRECSLESRAKHCGEACLGQIAQERIESAV